MFVNDGGLWIKQKYFFTFGTQEVIEKTFDILFKFDGDVIIFFGAFTGSSNPESERENKHLFFPEAKYIGEVWSSIQECVTAREAIKKTKLDNKPIIIVTDEVHSRRCGLAWNILCPYRDIWIISVPLMDTIDKNSPMWLYHYAWITYFSRHFRLRYIGYGA